MTDPQTFPEALDAERVTQDQTTPPPVTQDETTPPPVTQNQTMPPPVTQDQTAPPPGGGTPAEEPSEQASRTPPPSPSEPRRSPWPSRGAATAGAAQRSFASTKVRLTVLGVALLLLAAFVVTGSAWTAPLAIVGIVTLVVAWFGSRLDGRLMLEWGESGVAFELKAEINAPEHPKRTVKSLAIPRRLDAVSNDPLLIESTGTTVEIDIEELKALIALAEAA